MSVNEVIVNRILFENKSKTKVSFEFYFNYCCIFFIFYLLFLFLTILDSQLKAVALFASYLCSRCVVNIISYK